MEKQIGFIGCGNMAQAMIGGMIKAEIIAPEKIIASATTDKTLLSVKDRFGIQTTKNNEEVAQAADILFLAVKPFMYTKVIEEIRDNVKDESIIVTIAAGITISSVEEAFQKDMKIIRTMPNTPSLVGEGMSAISVNQNVKEENLQEVLKLFQSFGEAEVIEEKLMDAVPAISGSAPAYVYMFIEALADGAVLQGFSREKAYKFASQTVMGAAKMVVETGIHPGILKDNVCSPGGTTIEAVATLEKQNFRAAIISAMESCTEKSIILSKQK